MKKDMMKNIIKSMKEKKVVVALSAVLVIFGSIIIHQNNKLNMIEKEFAYSFGGYGGYDDYGYYDNYENYDGFNFGDWDNYPTDGDEKSQGNENLEEKAGSTEENKNINDNNTEENKNVNDKNVDGFQINLDDSELSGENL